MAPGERSNRVLLLLLMLAVCVGALTTNGCKEDIQVTVEPDPRVFTLFAGLLSGGYGSTDPGAVLSPAQQRVRVALGNLDPAERADWERLLNDWTDPVAPEFVLTDGVLAGGGPPDFAGLAAPGAPPSLQGYLESLWVGQAKILYDATAEDHTAMGAPLASTAQDTVKQVLAYARVKKSPFDSLEVIPNPLACQGFSCSWLDPEARTAYVVLGPEDGDLTLALARETFRLCLDGSLLQDLEASGALESLKPVFELSRVRPFSQDRCGSLSDFLHENLARACALRAFPDGADVAASLAHEWDAGFTLVEGLYASLQAQYESANGSLSNAVAELVSALRASDVADRMDDRVPPEGYPVLPEGWEWVRCEDADVSWYEAYGTISGPLRAPFGGDYYSVLRSWADEWGLTLLSRDGETYVDIWVVPGLTTRPTSWPEWGDIVRVKEGDVLPVPVGGVAIDIYEAASTVEEREAILDRLLGGE